MSSVRKWAKLRVDEMEKYHTYHKIYKSGATGIKSFCHDQRYLFHVSYLVSSTHHKIVEERRCGLLCGIEGICGQKAVRETERREGEKERKFSGGESGHREARQAEREGGREEREREESEKERERESE